MSCFSIHCKVGNVFVVVNNSCNSYSFHFGDGLWLPFWSSTHNKHCITMFNILKTKLQEVSELFVSSRDRLLHFSISNALRPYLKDELQQDQFSIGLLDGTFNLENLPLSEQVLYLSLHSSPFCVIICLFSLTAMRAHCHAFFIAPCVMSSLNAILNMCIMSNLLQTLKWQFHLLGTEQETEWYSAFSNSKCTHW